MILHARFILHSLATSSASSGLVNIYWTNNYSIVYVSVLFVTIFLLFIRESSAYALDLVLLLPVWIHAHHKCTVLQIDRL